MMSDSTRHGLLRTAGMVLVAALVAVTVVFLIAQAATDSLSVTLPGNDAAQEVGVSDALFATVLAGILSTVLAWGMSCFLARPRRTFLVSCVVGLVLYGLVPFAVAEDTATGVWLNLMHLTVAIPMVGGLAMYLPGTRARSRS